MTQTTTRRATATPYRALQAPKNMGSVLKPGELIDIVEMTPISLTDRRIYNLLIDNAWESLDQPVEHCVPKKDLRGSHNVNDRVGQSIERLMGAIAKVRVEKDGEPAIQRIRLLGTNIEHERGDGYFYYRFDDDFRAIVRDSRIFARIHKDVMMALSSKYALALYEMVQKRGNLQDRWYEDFPIEAFREMLSVPAGKLKRFSDFNKYAIKPAVSEVHGLSDFGVKIRPLKQGKRVTHIRLSWHRKSTDELKVAFTELQRCRVGRKARLNHLTEVVKSISA